MEETYEDMQKSKEYTEQLLKGVRLSRANLEQLEADLQKEISTIQDRMITYLHQKKGTLDASNS